MTVDLDDTRACPVAASCAACEGVDGLGVGTLETPVGVFCVTLCDECVDAGRLPRLAAVEAVRATLDHCGHLGIDADMMAAELARTADEFVG